MAPLLWEYFTIAGEKEIAVTYGHALDTRTAG
jgi:hypothetical protein